MSQYDLMLYLKIKLSRWPVFHGSVIFALYIEGYLMYKHDTLG